MKETLSLEWWGNAFRRFGYRGWLFTSIGVVVTLTITALPTAIINNPFFTRMTPVRTQDYIIWVATGLMAGIVAGTFAVPVRACASGRAISGGFLSVIATACPICNKLVVLLLGTAGALTYFGPAQLYIGIISLALLGWALYLRVKLINTAFQAASPQTG